MADARRPAPDELSNRSTTTRSIATPGLSPSVQIVLRLPPDAATVSTVRAIAGDTLRGLGVAPRSIDDVRLVLSEACANVIRHATTTDEYEVRLEVVGRSCIIEVVDFGEQTDLTALSTEMPDSDSTRGRGVPIMRVLAEELQFTSGPETGNVVRMATHLTVERGRP